ncbi:MAG: RHS repeat protein [Anaerolineae bacterium]|nr:RHS repeat protein [Anaerolineae bacterium]
MYNYTQYYGVNYSGEGFGLFGQVAQTYDSNGVNTAVKYGYDANGNQIARTLSGSLSTLTYDAENRLTAVSGATSASFVYDGACSETGTATASKP